ncbi:DUF2383 domain-containing protein [Pokkaliibacter sp. CJK22405]|uniref:DUF2383 domain-containing protein n=1 Tax=Pokkaliibacter sp. CJK22405 TaxID=3384615 RepID=UPI003984830B
MLSRSLAENDAQAIAHFVSACEDGKHFYVHALKEVKLKDLRDLFLDLAAVRDEIEKALEPEYEARVGKPLRRHRSFEGRINEWFAEARESLQDPGRENYFLVKELEEAEDRTLIEMQRAINDVLDPKLKNRMNDFLTLMHKSHQQMLTYKRGMEGDARPSFS